MKKSILNIGKALNKAEQKQVNGGMNGICDCTSNYTQVSQNECIFSPVGGGPFMCAGVIVDGQCCISSL
ncbi:hypothetical protein AAON49_13845 [Pseudotenacibaculum sp. MALMAid0570]|uniref:hypothetical protein n=1 Tax=Pseudotenacibaculum sp. MALMAid0570 TaxID=3143938 RepID=UPI0032DF26CA